MVVRGRLLLPGEIDYKGLHGVATAVVGPIISMENVNMATDTH